MMTIVPFLISLLVRFISLTNRRTIVHRENFEQAKKMSEHGNYAMASWHQNLFCGIIAGIKPFVSMTSRSKDGEIAARSAEHVGIRCTRGSSSRGGRAAMEEMIDLIKETNLPCALTVDGPRGPAKEPKRGILKIAHECKIPILPYVCIPSRRKEFPKSWDNFRLPLPFGRIYVGYGKPFMIEAIDDESLDKYAKMLIDESQKVEDEILQILQ